MRFRWAAAGALLTFGSAVHAKSITLEVKVVDRTRDVLFIEPGADRGLRPGDIVELRGRKRKVLSTSARFAAVDAAGPAVEIGTQGVATIEADRTSASVERIAPNEPLSAFRGQWQAPVLPATTQKPKPVPLGPVVQASNNRLVLRLAGSGVVPLQGPGEALGRTEGRARLHYEPLREIPFAVDADLSAQAWFPNDVGASPESRPILAVRQLEAGYGADLSAKAAAGRLRYASSSVGMLDGVRVETPTLSGFSLAAFGGLIADPLSGAPEARASRFGAELRYDDPEAAMRPHLVLGGHASRFEGSLDERRLNASADFYPDIGRFGARGEMSLFDRQNPWGADAAELSAVDADVGLELGEVQFGVAAGMRRPERSRWLASYLPPEWLCIRPAGALAAGPCVGDAAVYTGSAGAGVRLPDVWVDVGGFAARTDGVESSQAGGFANVRLPDLVGKLRLDGGAMLSRGSIIRTAALVFTPGIELFDGRLDASLRYRPAITSYVADTGPFVEHDVGPSIWFAPSPVVDVTLDGDWISGRDLNVVLFQAAVGWRPGI